MPATRALLSQRQSSANGSGKNPLERWHNAPLVVEPLLFSVKTMTTDLQAAIDNIDIDNRDSAVKIVTRVHQALRKGFAEFKNMMEDAVETRAGLAQDIGMQLELHIKCTSEILYPVLLSHLPDRIGRLSQAQQDIQECIDVLRPKTSADGGLDASMLRLMALAEYFMGEEMRMLDVATTEFEVLMRDLGARMMRRRVEIAGALEDLGSRS